MRAVESIVPRRAGLALVSAVAVWCTAIVASPVTSPPVQTAPGAATGQDGHSHHAPAQARLVVNPLRVTPDDLARGRAAYEQECSSCHGDDGRAQTARAGRMTVRPTDLTNPDLRRHADGEVFWVVTHGVPASKMPGFADDFSDEDRWRIVAYVRTLGRPDAAAPLTPTSGDLNPPFEGAAPPPYAWRLPPGFPEPKVPADNPMTPEKVELGRHLFYDTRLSVTGAFSCASCHQQALAFTDGRARAKGATGEIHPRGSMSLANIAYAPVLTWANPTMRKLEPQLLVPMFGEDPVELGLSGQERPLLNRINGEPRYRRLFASAFPGQLQPVTLANLARAIASFQRVLISGRSPYDRYRFSGDASAISTAAKRGETLFFDERLECFHCHGSFNFTETVDHVGKGFAEIEFHNTGLYNIGGKGAYPVENTGVMQVTGNPEDMGRFKAPTLRNIAVTAPYMHDGSVKTLDEVIDHYAAGGRTIHGGPRGGVGAENPYKSAFVKPIDLTPQERTDLKAFLESLTDAEFLRDPRFANPWIASGQRKR